MQVREAVTSLAASVDGNEFVLSGISPSEQALARFDRWSLSAIGMLRQYPR